MASVDYQVLDPFHRALLKELIGDYENRMRTLAAGGAFTTRGDSALGADPKTTGEKYAEQVGYLQCLETVMEVCRRVERNMMGLEPEG